ncbi:hypothetical protein T12_15720 [Trichinella patagoniensis]|uniref:Uncharacterized protein n=1 Tax=Trichinella patagoniensis TaxID=990121 RepID=A0A0V0ZHQ3_9BILA|nr:hypothetical protein T12_15720 [Trichinella patagoniensis]
MINFEQAALHRGEFSLWLIYYSRRAQYEENRMTIFYASTNSGGQTFNAEKIVLEVSILSLRDGNEQQNKTSHKKEKEKDRNSL